MRNIKKLIFIFLLTSLFLLAIISLIQGIHNGITDDGSSDMQWSPARLLLQGVDPYQYWMNGNVSKKIILYQIPNYLHILYLLMLPLATLKWQYAKIIWVLINAILGISTVLILCKKENISYQNKLIILGIFMCSTPFRNVLGLGQQSIFSLFFVTLSMYSFKNIHYIISTSLAIAKYSFAPPFIFYEYYKNGLNRIIGVFFVVLLSVFIFSTITKAHFFEVMAEPLLVSKNGSDNGIADIMSMCNIFLQKNYWLIGYLLSMIFSSLMVFIYCRIKTSDSLLLNFSYFSLIALISFKHLNYDYIFLLPLFIYAINFNMMLRVMIYAIVFWFWFGTKILYLYVHNYNPMIAVPFNFMLVLIAIIIVFLYSEDKNPVTVPIKVHK